MTPCYLCHSDAHSTFHTNLAAGMPVSEWNIWGTAGSQGWICDVFSGVFPVETTPHHHRTPCAAWQERWMNLHS